MVLPRTLRPGARQRPRHARASNQRVGEDSEAETQAGLLLKTIGEGVGGNGKVQIYCSIVLNLFCLHLCIISPISIVSFFFRFNDLLTTQTWS